jgi:hypothetical protein
MDNQLQEAIKFIKAGDKTQGQQLLAQIIKADPRNETAWLWMTTVLDDPQKKKKCLQNVLQINPDNEMAKKGLAQLELQQQKPAKLTPVEQPKLENLTPPAEFIAPSPPIEHMPRQEAVEQSPSPIQPEKPAIVQKTERKQVKSIQSLPKPTIKQGLSGPQVSDRQLLEPYIAKRTNEGWQVISQTESSVQLRKPKRWSKLLLILGAILLLFGGFGLIFWLLALIDYVIKKEQIIFVTADDLRGGTDKKPASTLQGPLILAGAMIGLFILCIAFALLPALFMSPSGNVSSKATPTVQGDEQSAPQILPTPTPIALQGSIKVTRQQLVQHFENQGFVWREETYKDGTHFMSGQSTDGIQKLNLWSTDNPEDLAEIYFSFTFPHQLYFLSDKNEDERFRKGLLGMIETQSIIFPNWSEGENWIRTGVQSLPEPLSDDKEIETRIDGAEVYLGMGDLSEQEYVVSFSVSE